MVNDEVRGKGTLWWASMVLAGVLVLYVGIFLFVVLDELVLETFWISDVMPDAVEEVFSTIYAPLIWLVEELG